MKRSRKLQLTTLMAAGGVSLAACGDTPPTTWDAAQADQGPSVDAFSYRTIEACKAANEVPDTACEDAGRIAIADQEKNAPRYDERRTCEEVYGEGQCVPRSQAGGGGSFWGPLITGFVVGQMLDGGWRGTGMYRDRYGAYHTGYGGRMWTDYSTGRTRIGARGIDPPDVIRQAPPKVQTRASVISRGGFGGRMSARSSGGRGFGG